MNSPQQQVASYPGWQGWHGRRRVPFERKLLWAVDAGLFATICVAPFVFGGRHDLGRLIFSTLVVLTAIAWLFRQCLLPKPYWTRTAAHGILLLATALVIVQMVPLPTAAIEWLAPRTTKLLPLWTPGASNVSLGTWQTITLTPHETALSLSMLLSYCLLFIVVAQRVQAAEDVVRLLKWVAISAVIMAGFGLVQYFTTNGKFFWFYQHPFRTTGEYVQGSFANRNHFASFLVLGLGPLVAWLIATAAPQSTGRARPKRVSGPALDLRKHGLFVAVGIVLVAILLSLSRGGALALAASALTISFVYFRWGRIEAKHTTGAVGFMIVLLGVLSVYGYEKVADRLDDLTEGSLQTLDRKEGRRKIWAANLAAFEDGWLTGAGAGSHREIYPVYLRDSPATEYTHAENGYLQIATEMGIGGLALLAAVFGLCSSWCYTCLARLKSAPAQLWFGAVAAGLVASAVHSVVDFVWYIPACMSVTVILAACALRLAQFSLPEAHAVAWHRQLTRPRCFELAAAGGLIGIWCICTLFGPAAASIHWDRYLRSSVDKSRAARKLLAELLDKREHIDSSAAGPLLESMLRHLDDVEYWDRSYSRVQLRLASKCIARFELLQRQSANAMQLFQLREAALASRFGSPAELRAWLERAAGENVVWLYRAYEHAKRAVANCPLQGEAYLHLANLCFLDCAPPHVSEAYVKQGLSVRPYDADVLFEAGSQKALAGDLPSAVEYWKQCFRNHGKHQLQIIHALAGPVPAAVLIQEFQPDWWTLRQFWTRYRQFGRLQDLIDLADYAAQVTQRQVDENGDIPPAYIWLCQAEMHSDLKRPADAQRALNRPIRRRPIFMKFAISLPAH